jgi:hypothetical protein
MTRYISAFALLGLVAAAAPAAAQSYVVSPAVNTNVEGLQSAYYFGRYPGGRYQFVDGEYRGTAMTMKGVAYRMDNYMHDTYSAMGRTWTNVTIHASEADSNNLTNRFSNNPTTTPTLVFTSNVDWSSMTGKPPYLPADWTISFPFSTNWNYTGNQDICLDFVFAGGTLANSGAWGSTTSKYYYLDGASDATYTRVTSDRMGPAYNQGGCNDRSRTDLWGATLSTTCDVYSDNPTNSSKAGNMLFTQSASYFGLSVPVIFALGLRSVPGGWDFPGVYCNKMYIDMSLPFLTFNLFTNSSGAVTFDFGTGPNGVPYFAAFEGVELVTQAAWADKLNKRLLFSTAASAHVPAKPPYFNRSVISTYNSAAVTGSGPNFSYWENPITRYTR